MLCGAKLLDGYHVIIPIYMNKSPQIIFGLCTNSWFYSCVLGCQAFEQEWG